MLGRVALWDTLILLEDVGWGWGTGLAQLPAGPAFLPSAFPLSLLPLGQLIPTEHLSYIEHMLSAGNPVMYKVDMIPAFLEVKN